MAELYDVSCVCYRLTTEELVRVLPILNDRVYREYLKNHYEVHGYEGLPEMTVTPIPISNVSGIYYSGKWALGFKVTGSEEYRKERIDTLNHYIQTCAGIE